MITGVVTMVLGPVVGEEGFVIGAAVGAPEAPLDAEADGNEDWDMIGDVPAMIMPFVVISAKEIEDGATIDDT